MTIGKRIPDGEFVTEPGGYSKHIVSAEDGDHIAWMMRAPNGGPVFLIGQPNRDGSPCHVVEENDDGTITVRPKPPADPDNSNSILIYGAGRTTHWHGYIDHGVWNACE